MAGSRDREGERCGVLPPQQPLPPPCVCRPSLEGPQARQSYIVPAYHWRPRRRKALLGLWLGCDLPRAYIPNYLHR